MCYGNRVARANNARLGRSRRCYILPPPLWFFFFRPTFYYASTMNHCFFRLPQPSYHPIIHLSLRVYPLPTRSNQSNHSSYWSWFNLQALGCGFRSTSSWLGERLRRLSSQNDRTTTATQSGAATRLPNTPSQFRYVLNSWFFIFNFCLVNPKIYLINNTFKSTFAKVNLARIFSSLFLCPFILVNLSEILYSRFSVFVRFLLAHRLKIDNALKKALKNKQAPTANLLLSSAFSNCNSFICF
jgi:hypothetical protein